jgi:AmpD protein
LLEFDDNYEWFESARRVVSPNCDERPGGCGIDAVIIHGISLPPGRYGGPYIDQLFTNTLEVNVHDYFRGIESLRVSSHLLIDRKGALTQYVPFSKRAWHAGESRLGGRGACNDFSIGIELEGRDDEAYEEAQYRRLAEAVAALQGRWPGIRRERIVGHCDVAPGRKTDPGSAFDWGYFFRLLD